jgi:2-polyprenyl-6-methoxyphenol hydroxylase-like FAD-dependent oxidoreductase
VRNKIAEDRTRGLGHRRRRVSANTNAETGPDDHRSPGTKRAKGFRSHLARGFQDRRPQGFGLPLGRAFLVGDAANVHGPAGGQVMNTGMQDASLNRLKVSARSPDRLTANRSDQNWIRIVSW